jgi:hypothetical protein
MNENIMKKRVRILGYKITTRKTRCGQCSHPKIGGGYCGNSRARMKIFRGAKSKSYCFISSANFLIVAKEPKNLKTHEKRFKRIRLKRPKLFETII